MILLSLIFLGGFHVACDLGGIICPLLFPERTLSSLPFCSQPAHAQPRRLAFPLPLLPPQHTSLGLGVGAGRVQQDHGSQHHATCTVLGECPGSRRVPGWGATCSPHVAERPGHHGRARRFIYSPFSPQHKLWSQTAHPLFHCVGAGRLWGQVTPPYSALEARIMEMALRCEVTGLARAGCSPCGGQC